MKSSSQLKQEVAQHLLPELKKETVVLLGSGTTVNTIVKALENTDIECVSSSLGTQQAVKSSGLIQRDLDQINDIKPVCVDGADLVLKKSKYIIKGHGGALVREKITWKKAGQVIVAIDESKLQDTISTTIPVAVIPFGLETTVTRLQELKQVRKADLHYRGGLPFRSDDGLLVIHLTVNEDIDLSRFDQVLHHIVGVVETGIFLPNDFENIRFVCGKQTGIEEF